MENASRLFADLFLRPNEPHACPLCKDTGFVEAFEVGGVKFKTACPRRCEPNLQRIVEEVFSPHGPGHN